MFESHSNADYRLRAMWALHCIQQMPWQAGASKPSLKAALKDSDPHIRAWAIQLACEDGPVETPDADLVDALLDVAGEESSPVVRMYLASSLQRIGGADRVWDLAELLMQYGEDADDHNIPKLLWFGIEPHVVGNADRALEVAANSKIPQLTQFIARRLADGNQLKQLVGNIGQSNEANQTLLLRGMRDALQGRIDLQPPSNWEAVYKKTQSNSIIR